MSKFDITKVKNTNDIVQALTQTKPKSFYMAPSKAYIQRNQGDI